MIFRFDDFVLDTDRAELRTATGALVPLERQVYQLLALLLENGDVLTSRDEIVSRVWGGRAISDAAVASRISAARAAIDDDGRRQARIRTVHGQGVRFVAPITQGAAAGPVAGGKPSIAVLPFRVLGGDPELLVFADALPHEVILQLSRLRWLTVIARGSTFRFREGQAADRVGAALEARYVLSGTLEPTRAGGAEVAVVLEDTRGGAVVWAERYPLDRDRAFEVKAEIARGIVVEIDAQIPLAEALAAQGTGTERLDAWSRYHLGLLHMYRFTQKDNDTAKVHFRQAIALDPLFARAHAGLSFARFQDAFTFYVSDRSAAMEESRGAAERALELDPRDPFASFAMGRYHWLDHDLDAGRTYLERAVALNPNYAQGIYSLAFTDTMAGRGPQALEEAETSMRLSPLDPLLYGMLGTRALSTLQTGDAAVAAQLGDRAARAPGAHYLIGMLAVATNALGGQDAVAEGWGARVRQRRPDATREQFLRSFPFQVPEVRGRIDGALARFGF